MSTEKTNLRVLYLGSDEPDIQRIKQILLDYFKCPVFVHHIPSSDLSVPIVRGRKADVILVPCAPGDPSAFKAVEMAFSARPDVPLVCLIKKISREDATRLIRSGAADCLPVESLNRLPFIIGRELIRHKRFNEDALRLSENRAMQLIREMEKTKEDMTREIDALRKLHLIGSVHSMLNDLNYIYDAILDAAIDITHADKGCLQIWVEQENSLKIIAQRGLSEEFSGLAAMNICGWKGLSSATQEISRIITPNLWDSMILNDSALTLVRAENIRCMQSTPMASCTGRLYGMLSTFYKENHDFGERELRFLDLLARQVADFIERKRSDVALEISEKNAKALVETLQKVDRSKDDFLNHLTHELRNPLATIIAAISLIEISNDIYQIKETTAILKNETKQLNRLIDDLLDVTRISTNKVKLRKKIINLNETILNSANNFQPQFSSKGIRFVSEVNRPPIYLEADPSRIMQIVENLLMNALIYTDEGGEVILTLNEDRGDAVIRVKDNGIGVSPDELPMLFNAFYQAEKSPNRLDSGLGLGLSVVKGMAELHNGRVSAYSKGVGLGSCFTVALPIKDEASESFSSSQL